MGYPVDTWRARVEPHFGFLAERGFVEVSGDDSSWWATWVQYRSAAAAVRVSRSEELRGVEVHLIRLVDGLVPPYPVWITSERIDWVMLDDAVAMLRPDLLRAAPRASGLRDGAVERQLAFWAGAARALLHDDASVVAAIDAAALEVRRRVERSPQTMTVWLPADASASDEEDAARNAAVGVPPEVAVAVRRYRRPGSWLSWRPWRRR